MISISFVVEFPSKIDQYSSPRAKYQFSESFQISSKISQPYDDHDPIIIDGNDNFQIQANNEMWQGNGTINFPYIIERIDITSNSEVLIDISNTAVYFEIRNIIVKGGFGGISLNNVTNGSIINSSISISYFYGINLAKSWNTVISNNTISNIQQTGISLVNSGNCTLSNNKVINVGIDGFLIWASINCYISNNSIIHNGNYGARFTNSRDCTLLNNSITYHGNDGVKLENSNNCTLWSNYISHNDFKGSFTGVFIQNTGNCTIVGNKLENNTFTISGENIDHYFQTDIQNNSINGKKLVFWQNIQSEIVPENAEQIILVNCDSVMVNNQKLKSLSTFYCLNISLHNNEISNSKTHGIILDHTDECTLDGNIITKSSKSGILLSHSTFNEFFNNSVMNNLQNGIEAQASGLNSIYNNTVFNNSQGILYQETNSGLIETNLLFNNSNFGVNLLKSNFINVRRNNFYGNNYGNSQAHDSGINNVVEKNFWNEWTTPDNNLDEIVDSPYILAGSSLNQDESPRTIPYEILGGFSPWHYVPFHEITVPKIMHPNGMETLSGTITVKWDSSLDPYFHIIHYSVYYSSDCGVTWDQIESNLYTTELLWNTNTVQDGFSYLLKVVATCSIGITAWDVSDWLFTIQNGNSTPDESSTTQNSTDFGFLFLGTGVILFSGYKRRQKKKMNLFLKSEKKRGET